MLSELRSPVLPSTTERIFVAEPNAGVRAGIVDILTSEQYEVQVCNSVRQVIDAAARQPCTVALVAWQSMDGLLAQEHRHDLVECARRLHLVIMVPRRWVRMLDAEALGGARILEKPFDADRLMTCISAAKLAYLEAPSMIGL